MTHFAGYASLVVLTIAFLQPGGEDPARLAPDEAVYIHAAALKIQEPSMGKDEFKTAAKKSTREENPRWKSSKDLLLKSLASLEDDPKLRKSYRASLKKRLGDNPRRNSEKLFAEISKNYSREKVAKYRAELKKSEGKSLPATACPWPACLRLCPPCPDE
ncbi:MAG TPA: hypothetical protein VMG10_26680 [Gemmataceae bacterium]|nr:hypothetical protein [Gemmataceae bacterium]